MMSMCDCVSCVCVYFCATREYYVNYFPSVYLPSVRCHDTPIKPPHCTHTTHTRVNISHSTCYLFYLVSFKSTYRVVCLFRFVSGCTTDIQQGYILHRAEDSLKFGSQGKLAGKSAQIGRKTQKTCEKHAKRGEKRILTRPGGKDN